MATAPNVLAALFSALAGAVFLFFALLHLRARPTLIRGRTITLACVLAILFPLFVQPIRELLKGALLGETYAWANLLRLALFVVVTLGLAWYFRGWLLFNVDTSTLGELIQESCRAADVPCRPAGGKEDETGFRLGEEERELHLRREPGSRYASLLLASDRGLPWLERFTKELRGRVGQRRLGRYYARAIIFLLIGLACLGFAVILFAPERLGFVGVPVPPPTTFYR